MPTTWGRFFLTAMLMSSSLVAAQTTYRWVDPVTGQTVISDQAPPQNAKQVVMRKGPEASGEAQLPFATRQAAEKFPVTLYTSADCIAECKLGRDLLNGRGIPFTETMLKTPQELAELSKQLGSDARVPSIGVGRQYFRGYEIGAWNNLLDLAGYPKTAPYGAKASGAFAQ
jgi:Domain of unknown function (DUF4124)